MAYHRWTPLERIVRWVVTIINDWYDDWMDRRSDRPGYWTPGMPGETGHLYPPAE